MKVDEILSLLHALPIRPEHVGKMTEIRRQVFNLGRERDALEGERNEWKRTVDMYARAWIRELGGRVFRKSHEIDSLVKTTQHQRVGYERAKAAGLISDTFYRDDPRLLADPHAIRKLVDEELRSRES